MKRFSAICLILMLILQLGGCGQLPAAENTLTGKYYLAIRPDKKGKNTVASVEEETLRIKVNGEVVWLTPDGEREGSWEAERRHISLSFGEETVRGRLEEDRIVIGSSIYVRGKKAAESLLAEDAAAYVADPLAEYEGKYYLVGLLDGSDNRVEKIENITLWLMPEGEAMLFEDGRLTLLSWDGKDNSVLIRGEETAFQGRYENGRIDGVFEERAVVLLREKDEAQAYLAAHPYVPEPIPPHIPVVSGYEDLYYLAYATFLGKTVLLEETGMLRIWLKEDYLVTYTGTGFSEEGSYFVDEDGRITLTFNGEMLSGTLLDGRIDLEDTAGDCLTFINHLKKADAFRLRANEAARAAMDAAETAPLETGPSGTKPPAAESTSEPGRPEESAGAVEDGQDFWNGTWFGFVRLNDGCSGLYRMMRGKCYAVYVTLKIEEDGSGTLVAYDPAKTFSERLLVGKVQCGEGRTLTLTSGEIEAFHAALEEFSASYEEERKLVYFSLTKSVSGGAIGGELYLRRWGEGWEDLPDFMQQIPDYESYLEEIRTGVPRYSAD